MKNSLLKNSIFKSILSICNIIIPLIIGPYVTRLLDINLYGIFNKVIAELNVFIVIAGFGIYTYGVKEISKVRDNKEKVSEIFTNLFFISLVMNIIVSAVYVVYALLISQDITLAIYLIATIQFIANIIYVEYVNEALENYSFITKKTLLVRIFYLICILLMVKNPSDIIIYSIIYSGIIFVNNISSYIYVRKEIKFSLKKINVKKYLKSLIIVFLISSVEILYFQLDKVMLGKAINDISVSIYQIPYMIMSMIITIPTAVVSVSVPRLSNIYMNEGKKIYEDKLNSIFSYFMILLLPICFGIFSISKEIIIFYGGIKYIESVPLLMIFSIIRILIGLETFMTLLIIYINNYEKKILKIFAIIGFGNFFINFLLIKLSIFTPITAAFSTGMLYFILVIVEYKCIKNYLSIRINFCSKNNLMYLLLSSSFIFISYIIHIFVKSLILNAIIIILTCIIFYFVVLFIIKDKILINTISNIKNKLKRK